MKMCLIPLYGPDDSVAGCFVETDNLSVSNRVHETVREKQ